MKKYVLVGCGMRGVLSYAVPMVNEFSDCATLSGVYDPNKGRMKLVSELCGKSVKM
jgi:predicted dehydrogenase